jgi:predicted cation transporter
MITLKFLGTWLKITGLAVLAFIVQTVFLTSTVGHVVVTAVIALTYVGLTVALWREWAAVRRGDGAYTYQYIHYTRDE